jgi:hypothetical protein
MIFLNLIAFSIIIILNTKSCSNNPQNYSVSTIKISWKDNGDSTDIVMTNSMANNNWFAFGFSNDKSMVNIFIMKGQFQLTKNYFIKNLISKGR